MPQSAKSRVIGLNHIVLEVGGIEEVAFYGRLFTFELRGKSGTARALLRLIGALSP